MNRWCARNLTPMPTLVQDPQRRHQEGLGQVVQGLRHQDVEELSAPDRGCDQGWGWSLQCQLTLYKCVKGQINLFSIDLVVLDGVSFFRKIWKKSKFLFCIRYGKLGIINYLSIEVFLIIKWFLLNFEPSIWPKLTDIIKFWT